MSDRWYFEVLGESFGPVSVEELTRLAEAGELSQTDRVRPEQSENWQTAKELIDFSTISQSTPPSSTAVMSTGTQWNDGVTHTPKPSLDQFANIDELVLKQETSADRESVSLDRFLDQHGSATGFKLPNSPDKPSTDDDGSFELDESVQNQTGVIWYYKVAGIELGPVGKVELQMLIDRNKISRNDYIREGTKGAWQRSERVQDFRFPPLPKPKPAAAASQPAPVEPAPVEPQPTEQPVSIKPEPSEPAVSPTLETPVPAEEPIPATPKTPPAGQKATPAVSTTNPAPQTQPSPVSSKAPTPKANSVSANNPYTTTAPMRSTPRPKQASPRRRKKVGGGFDFDFSFLTGDVGKYVGIGIVVLLLGYGLFSLNLFGKGGGALVASETLWAEIQEAEQNNPDFSTVAKTVYLPRAKAILESIKGISNQESKVIARVRTGMKDGVVRFLELYPLAKEKTAKVANIQFEMARISYEGK